MEVSALKAPAAPGLRTPTALLRLQSDERLIALTRCGQHAAFEALFSRYHSRLLAFCRHMLGSKEDAEDVLQEVFAAAFNAVLADERAINVRPWLYRIARNRSLNHLRKASAIGVDSMDVHYAEHGVSTAEKAMRRESFRQLIGDVQQLPETQRTALLLREIDALSYEQIAVAMETTVPAVKSLLVRARISLAEAAEARRLSCEDARLELGEAAEGLVKTSAAVRRHVRDCERCRAFKKQLKDNNVALAAIMPVAPLLLLKKLLISKLGGTAGAGGAHVAGAGGAGAAATAGAAGGASMSGGLLTAGAGALASKAVAGLAVAAIVAAGTVEADHANAPAHRRHVAAVPAVSTLGESNEAEPVVAHTLAQPVSVAARPAAKPDAAKTASKATEQLHKAVAIVADPPPASTATEQAPVAASHDPQPTLPAKPSTAPVTQVTTESTPLPSTQGQGEVPAMPPSSEPPAGEATGTATTGTSPTEPTPPPTTETTPPPPPPPPAPTTPSEGTSAGSDQTGAGAGASTVTSDSASPETPPPAP